MYKVITYTANGVCPTIIVNNNNIIFSIPNVLRVSPNGTKLNRHARGFTIIRERNLWRGKKRQTVATRAMNSAVDGLLSTDRRFPRFGFRFAHITSSCIAYYTYLIIIGTYIEKKRTSSSSAAPNRNSYDIILYCIQCKVIARIEHNMI